MQLSPGRGSLAPSTRRRRREARLREPCRRTWVRILAGLPGCSLAPLSLAFLSPLSTERQVGTCLVGRAWGLVAHGGLVHCRGQACVDVSGSRRLFLWAHLGLSRRGTWASCQASEVPWPRLHAAGPSCLPTGCGGAGNHVPPTCSFSGSQRTAPAGHGLCLLVVLFESLVTGDASILRVLVTACCLFGAVLIHVFIHFKVRLLFVAGVLYIFWTHFVLIPNIQDWWLEELAALSPACTGFHLGWFPV